MKPQTHRGFTLIELLVVISIIAVLAGLVIGLVPMVRLKAKLADTQVRINSVQTGISQIGQAEGSATYRLQMLTEYRPTGTPTDLEPGLGGIMTFGPPDTTNPGLPTIGKRPPPKQADDNGAWGQRGRGHLAFPWGKKFPDPSNTGASSILMGPERFRLRHLSPFNTRKLLKIANVLPTKQSDAAWPETQYMTNRKQSEPWNDAWGHPLVVASAIYQPTWKDASPRPTIPGWLEGAWPTPANPSTPLDPKTAPRTGYVPADEVSAKKALLDHLKLYQYNRSVYIAVAAVGPNTWVNSEEDLKSSTASIWANSATNPTSGLLDDLWGQANWVCQQAKLNEFDKDWSELSMDNPMWNGVKYDYLTNARAAADKNNTYYQSKRKGKEDHCSLSAPQEYR